MNRILRLALLAPVFCTLLCSLAMADELTPVASGIEMHPNKRITAGDDIIVFGTGGFAGVDYIVPSAGDNKGRGIPNGNTYHAASFAVAGKKIALINNFVVTIFDTTSGKSAIIPVDDLRLTTVPGQLHDAGHIQADGSYVICRSDKSTKDQRFIKIIDVNEAKPKLISFKHSPPLIRADFVKHVMLDSKNNRAVAATQEAFFVYDIRRPEAKPERFETPDGIADLPPQLDGNYILFQDREAYPNTSLLNLSTKKIIPLRTNPSAGTLQMTNGSVAYFVKTNSKDGVGNGIRCAIGKVNDLANILLSPERKFINGRTANHGAYGYGETVAIAPSGKTWFLGGLSSVGAGEYLQVSSGGEFRLVADPRAKDKHGCYATDVTICNSTLAFKTKGDDYRAAYVGYAILR